MNTIDSYRFFPSLKFLVVLAALVLTASCATQHKELLVSASTSLRMAQQDPMVANNAEVPLHDAEQTLQRAERATNREDVMTLGYVVEKKVAIARAEAERKVAEGSTEQLLKERDKITMDDLQRQLADLKAEKTQRGYMVTLGNVLFDYNKASLKPGAQEILLRLASFLKSYPKRGVLIEGYTDSTGSANYNLDLSTRRAESVAEFLMDNGIAPGRISANGYGSVNPVASNSSEAGRLQNRRVEVVILDEKPSPAVEILEHR